MTTATEAPPSRTRGDLIDTIVRTPTLGPLFALVVAVVVFSLTTDTFLDTGNLSLVLQQSVVVGVLALGQTLIILTAGIDLANGAIMVFGTILMAKWVVDGGHPVVALALGIVVCAVLGGISGGLVTSLRLPPFIVTLGLLTVVFAVTRLYSASKSYPVTDDVLGLLGKGFLVGPTAFVTYGTIFMFVLYGLMWYALAKTGWGRHVYAVGNNPEAARLTGIKVGRVLFSVYVTAGVIYGLAAWEALGRIPNADANAYQNANLDSITAVVIGGTSLFGGRGSVVGTLIGTLIVAVLRSGLTQAGIDSLYQDVATGILVIVAVAVDQLARRRQR
ncbi:MAG: transporter permease [Mycobacterium sp.]|nr:transporter permease [Mycobacterium sp.]